jgi:hypothetical protein
MLPLSASFRYYRLRTSEGTRVNYLGGNRFSIMKHIARLWVFVGPLNLELIEHAHRSTRLHGEVLRASLHRRPLNSRRQGRRRVGTVGRWYCRMEDVGTASSIWGSCGASHRTTLIDDLNLKT